LVCHLRDSLSHWLLDLDLVLISSCYLSTMPSDIECLMTEIRTLTQSVNDLRTDISSIKKDISQIRIMTDSVEKSLQGVSKTVTELEHRAKLSETEVNLLKYKYTSLQERVIKMEAYSRKDNLLISGITEPEKETDLDCLKSVYNVFSNTLGIPDAQNMRIVRCHRLGSPRNNQTKKPRTIIVKFHWFGDRVKVWENRKNLKGTGIFLNEDLPHEIIDRRNVLTPCMKEARKRGYKAFLSDDKLHITFSNGKRSVYSIDTIHHLPQELHPHNVSAKQNDTCLVFFTKSCPLSNFYPSPIIVDGQKFLHVEQYFQCAKAAFANDESGVKRIMESESPLQCKLVGDRLKINKVAWQNKAPEVMEKALFHKINQNRTVKQFLMETGKKILGEASSTDKFWGTGVSLNSSKAVDPNSWLGNNHMGKILMKLRDTL